jgi:outer membrane protein OmpA-like peptidoglycan-associated protein
VPNHRSKKDCLLYKNINSRRFLRNYLLLLSILTIIPAPSAAQEWSEIRNCTELNTAHDEFAPNINRHENILYFNSTQNGTSQFYKAILTSELQFLKTELLTSGLNEKRSNQSYITFASDGNAIYSAFRQTPRNSVLNLFESNFKNGVWVEKHSVEKLNEDSFTAHPSISADGRLLVFSSSRANGEGGTDLWISRRSTQEGNWLEPSNLGDKLNSERDEITPFFAGNDTLYFASNGFGGKGGFDIFISVLEDGEWQVPVALHSINSSANESDFAVLKTGVAMFASDKPGGRGGLDLYLARAGSRTVNTLVNDVELSFKADVESITVTREQRDSAIIPLIPYIFFKTGSAALPQFFKKADEFFSESAIRNSDELYSNLLNIVGSRLKHYPEAKLIIEGWSVEAASGVATGALSHDRVQSVVQFLKDNWNISDDQLITGFHELPQNTNRQLAEQRRIELSTDFAPILAPVISNISVLSVVPETITLSVDARPRNSISNWKIENSSGLSVKDSVYFDIPSKVEIPLRFIEPTFSEPTLRFILRANDVSGNSSQIPIDLAVQNVTVTRGRVIHEFPLFLLKSDDVQRDPGVERLIKIARNVKSAHTIRIKHLNSFESRLRAELLLKELTIIGNQFLKMELQKVDAIAGLPETLVQLSKFSVGVKIEEGF